MPDREAEVPFCQLVVEDLTPDTLRVEGSEARHLGASLRARPGDRYAATDGRGTRAVVEVERVGRKTVELTVVSRSRVSPPARRWWLATAAAERRLDWVIEKAVELGAWGLIPLASPTHGGGRDRWPARQGRWARLAVAALGQCLGSWSLRVRPAGPLSAILAGGPADPEGTWEAVVWADPGGTPALALVPERLPAGDILLAVGRPEGFTPGERVALEGIEGGIALRLGARRLRSETAALAALAWAGLREDEEMQKHRKDSAWG